MNTDFILSLEKQDVRSKYTSCPICGKKFWVSGSQYTYKKPNKNNYMRFACSYSCFKKLDEVIIHSRKKIIEEEKK